MGFTASGGDAPAKIMRWTARVVLGLCLGFGHIMFWSYAIFGDEHSSGPIPAGFVIFIIAFIVVTIAYILAWKWEHIGGGIIAGFGILMGAMVFITAGHNQFPASVMISTPFILPGVMLVASHIRTKGSLCKRDADQAEYDEGDK